MSKDKEIFGLTIASFQCNALQYDEKTRTIRLPNLSWVKRKFGYLPKESELAGIKHLCQSFTHEFLHFWLHENIGYGAMYEWDNIDKNRENTEYLISSIGSL